LMKTMNLVKTINTRSDTEINSSLIFIIWKLNELMTTLSLNSNLQPFKSALVKTWSWKKNQKI
jgi:hypothetical protein